VSTDLWNISAMISKLWHTIDKNILKSLPNAAKGYEQRIHIPEFTFLGAQEQPDFGVIRIWFYGDTKTIELKSFKLYLYQYRNTIMSYERCLDMLYKHIKETYEPMRVRIEIGFRPRGGISSKLVVDSDWGHLGGTDKLWQAHETE
jgi:7-cyano-7-deazaguanine reductase